jgi:selenocysteine-specific elongation factor
VLCPPRLLAAAVEAQLSAGRLAESRERAVLRLPTHRVVSGDEERALSERVAAVYGRAGLAPPRLDELPPQLWAEATGHPMATTPAPSAPELKQAVEGLIRGGTLVRVKDLLFHRQALDALRGRLVAFLQEHREINPTQWKDLVGQSRKYTIPLAEHFDAEKLTLRVGDLRRLRVGPAR